MFKKEPRIKALSNLKNSDRKKLLQSARTQFSVQELSIPSTSEIKQTNFVAPTALGTIYTNNDGIPIFFKEKHSERLYPSVYTCWYNAGLIPIIKTHGPVIEDHIFNGANLMIAGTVPPFDPDLKIGKICGICSSQKPGVVVAIGIVREEDMSKYNSGVVGKTGVAVEVLHHLEDGLFKAFKVTPQIPEIVYDTEEHHHEHEEEKVKEDKSESVDSYSNSSKPVEQRGATETVNQAASDELDTHPVVNANTDTDAGSGTITDETQPEASMDTNDTELTTEDVDYLIRRSLFYTILLDDRVELPISGSNFISKHIINNLPDVDHEKVNIKKSSWKKTSKFLKHFEKNGFLKLKGKDDNLTVVSLNKNKEELKNFVVYKPGRRKPTAMAGSSPSLTTTTTSSSTVSSSKKTDSTTTSVSLYKPINLGKQFVQVSNLTGGPYFTAVEIRKGLDGYIRDKNLVDSKNKSNVLMDDLLYDMVVSAKERKVQEVPRVLARAKLLEPILKQNFTEYFQLYRTDGTPMFKTPLRGAMPHVKIITEMKIGRKIVTKVSNFEIFQLTPEKLAADLRKLCSGSTTIGETMTSPKTAEVQVQGSHAKIVTQHLNKYGIPTKWIDVEDKVKPKKKK